MQYRFQYLCVREAAPQLPARSATARSSTNLHRGRGSISRYLRPGLARCAWCNGGVHVRTRTRSGGRELRYYACTSHCLRGESVCTNKVQVPMEAVDRAVLASITEPLTPDIAHDVLTRVRELVDAQVASDPRV